MDSNLLLLSNQASVSTPLPLFLSYKSPFLETPKLPTRSRLCVSANVLEKSDFWGKSLIIGNRNSACLGNPGRHNVGFEPIRAAVKRRKELPFDCVIQREKKLKLVMKIRKILLSQPDRIMSLRSLGRYRKDLGLKRKRRFIALLKKFPGVFEIVEEGAFALKFKLTAEAERVYFDELKIRNQMEELLVVKLRKLLMMSLEKRILLEKISHLRTDLGLPLEFRDTICHRYPQFFRVVTTERGPALELTHWDPELAVSAAELAEEENRARELHEKNLIIDRPLRFNRVRLPKGLKLSKGEMRKIEQFRDMPYISPYSDFSGLRSGTPPKEKHACGVIHEILSLTIEKRTLVDHFTHFREEFRFSQQLRGMLIRHPDMFYVSLKGERDSVFLREAYRDSHLIDKDPLILVKEKLRSLVAVPRFPKRGSLKKDPDGNEETGSAEEGEGTETDIEGSMTDDDWSDDDEEEEEEEDDDYEDDWSDEDDDLPPEFDNKEPTTNGLSSTSGKKTDTTGEMQEKELVPVFPDGRPRERW